MGVQKKVTKLVDFGFSLAPLLILVFTYKFTLSWKLAFYFASPFAVVSLVKAFIGKSRDVFLLAVNAFLSLGGLIFLFNIGWLQTLYKDFSYSMIFIWVFIISFVFTFFTQEKMFDLEVQDKRKLFNYSLYFITASIIALGFSFYFKTDYFFGAWLPFVTLLLLKDFLMTFIKGASFTKLYLLAGELGLILVATVFKKYIFVSLLILIVGRKILHSYFDE